MAPMKRNGEDSSAPEPVRVVRELRDPTPEDSFRVLDLLKYREV